MEKISILKTALFGLLACFFHYLSMSIESVFYEYYKVHNPYGTFQSFQFAKDVNILIFCFELGIFTVLSTIFHVLSRCFNIKNYFYVCLGLAFCTINYVMLFPDETFELYMILSIMFCTYLSYACLKFYDAITSKSIT
jgi:hypothetical protein